jgi:hypothetical protein
MTIAVYTDLGDYLEDDYLSGPYLSPSRVGYMGCQILFITSNTHEAGLQTKFQIVDHTDEYGNQINFVIAEDDVSGQQTQFLITETAPFAIQSNFSIVDHIESYGLQTNFVIADVDNRYGMQSNLVILDVNNRYGTQSNFVISDINNRYGMQTNIVISDINNRYGLQSKFIILDSDNRYGFQFIAVNSEIAAFQALITLYNTDLLRILCDFPSRGTPGQAGNSWTANSTEPGDFNANNLNTDIVEQIWRSTLGTVTGVTLTCDTGLPQGVFLDTFAALNHNLTTSALVTLVGATDSGFTNIVVSLVLEVTEENFYYIAPLIPDVSARYWRVNIDDAANPDNFISIGTIVFGASKVFIGECFVDEIPFQIQDFADRVGTEGHTNVSNSRAIKRRVELEFRSIDFNKRNFGIMRSMFKERRTVNKCLWIPTPSPDDQKVTDRFAVFGKMESIPTERHNNRGADADYVNFTVVVDESL